jgi:hypothetical protein
MKINGSNVWVPDPDSEIWVMADIGNEDVKGMLFPNFGQEVHFPHSIAMRDDSQWAVDCQQWKNRQYDQVSSVAFRCVEGNFLVGSQADQMGGYSLYGAEKYSRDHIGVLLKALLYRLYPEGHDNIKLVIMHPSRLNPTMQNAMIKAVIGKHVIELPDGKRKTYIVSEVFPLEEAVASFQTFLLSTSGERYKDHQFGGDRAKFEPGEEFINIDIGGYISYIGEGKVNENGGIEMNNYNAKPIQAGALSVYDVLQDSLKGKEDKFPGLSRLTTIPESMLREALLTNKITIKRKEYDCSEEVASAMNPLINAMKQEFTGRFKGGANAAVITVAGGGGGLSYKHLLKADGKKNYLIDHPYCYMVEENFKYMRYGGVRGAAKGTFLVIKGRSKNGK